LDETEARRIRIGLEASLRKAGFDLFIELPVYPLEDADDGSISEYRDVDRLSEVAILLAFVRRTQMLLKDLSSVQTALLAVEGVDSITFKPDPDSARHADLENAWDGDAVLRERRGFRVSHDEPQRTLWLNWIHALLGEVEAHASG
jgi:hypothetical protein